jgi:class 3 adenylate cyclase
MLSSLITGLPDKQPNHAVIMARFARDVILEMKEITRELAQRFGEHDDTLQSLQMRIGMHSGSTTAGVLRGEKGR